MTLCDLALCQKAWKESRVRFAIMVLALAWICAAIVLLQRIASARSDESMSYAQFIWKAVYRGAVRDLFTILAMLLGLGGLLQEQAKGTAGFTLALPVSRKRMVAARAVVGLAEVAFLSFIPAILLPLLSPLVNESYPLGAALTFGVLWTAGGSILFAATFLLSAVLAGEYTPWIVCTASLVAYMLLVSLWPLSLLPSLNFLQVMNGVGMPWFREAKYALVGPAPILPIAVMGLAAAFFIWAAGAVTESRDFS
ncbi:MAG TPA: hypothetical protein VH639_28475 [Bryobacteraceae bacterium]|jgi:ABC-type transport system involved in multi-copper enzyme maturation permease subunit